MSITLRRTWKVEGVLTDATSVNLQNPTNSYGVKRNDTNAVVVAAGTAMTKTATGTYETTFNEPATGLTYTAYIKVVYDSETYYFEVDLEGTTATDAILTAAEVQTELGITTPTAIETAVIAAAIRSTSGAVRRHLQFDPLYKQHTEYYPQTSYRVAEARRIWDSTTTQAILRDLASEATGDLQLKNIPVRSITALYVDYDGRSGRQAGAFGAETEKTEGTDFWANYDLVDSGNDPVCSDGILRSAGSWPNVSGTVKVIYYAGYKDAELHGQDSVLDASPIWETTLQEAARRARRAFVLAKTTRGFQAGVLTSENLGDYSYTVEGGSVQRLFGGDLLAESRERLDGFTNMAMYL